MMTRSEAKYDLQMRTSSLLARNMVDESPRDAQTAVGDGTAAGTGAGGLDGGEVGGEGGVPEVEVSGGGDGVAETLWKGISCQISIGK